MLPQLQQDYQANSSSGPYLRMGVLNQTQFPNRCGGWCGCDGATPRGPSQLMAHNDSHAHFLSGRRGFLYQREDLEPAQYTRPWVRASRSAKPGLWGSGSRVWGVGFRVGVGARVGWVPRARTCQADAATTDLVLDLSAQAECWLGDAMLHTVHLHACIHACMGPMRLWGASQSV